MVETDVFDKDAYRNSLLLFLDSIAVGGTTDKFGEVTPYLDSLSELLCMWVDDYYWRPEALVTDGIFLEKHFAALYEFSFALRAAYPKHVKLETVNINLLQNDPQWASVVEAAKKVMKELKKPA